MLGLAWNGSLSNGSIFFFQKCSGTKNLSDARNMNGKQERKIHLLLNTKSNKAAILSVIDGFSHNLLPTKLHDQEAHHAKWPLPVGQPVITEVCLCKNYPSPMGGGDSSNDPFGGLPVLVLYNGSPGMSRLMVPTSGRVGTTVLHKCISRR